jgi:hypothetical protein
VLLQQQTTVPNNYMSVKLNHVVAEGSRHAPGATEQPTQLLPRQDVISEPQAKLRSQPGATLTLTASISVDSNALTAPSDSAGPAGRSNTF